ncbi:methyltransferase domain-containing protein [Candidatus Woesearchaeota archaeon]|nr:methyltransferase domain-containing protein [Candidatus Woesearchaeota archaeon]
MDALQGIGLNKAAEALLPMAASAVKWLYERTWADLHFQRRAEWHYIRKWLAPRKGEHILDLACGGGFYSRKVAKVGCKVAAIDLSSSVIALAKKYNSHPNITYLAANGEKLPFPNSSFDKAFSVSSIEHFNNDMKAFKELNRVLRKGGALVISVDSFDHPDVNDKVRKAHAKQHHVAHFYTKEELRTRLMKAGFRVVESRYILNSKVSSAVMKLWIQMNFTRAFLLGFPVLYPLSRVSDMLSDKDKGYVLVVKAVKK